MFGSEAHLEDHRVLKLLLALSGHRLAEVLHVRQCPALEAIDKGVRLLQYMYVHRSLTAAQQQPSPL